MPTYELSLILRQMAKPELVTTLKRTASSIFEKGGFIRTLNNVGFKPLPRKITSHGYPYRKGAYFVIEFDLPPTAMEDVNEEWGRDVDIIKRFVVKKEEPKIFGCTLEKELLPPAYRKDVADMIHTARNSKKFKQEQKRTGWTSGTGWDYYPFQ